MKISSSIKWLIQSTRTIYFRVILSAIIIGVLLLVLPLSEIWDAAKRVSMWWWGFFVLAFLVIHTVGVFKWRFIVNMGKSKLPFSLAFRCYFYGLFGNLFLPSVVGGDLVRAGMAVRHVEEKEQILIGSIMDRFLDVCSLLGIIIVGAILTEENLSNQHLKVLAVIFSVLAIGLILGIALSLVPIPDRMPKKVHEIMKRTRLILRHLLKHPVYALGTFSLAIVIQCSFVLLNAFLGSICGIEIDIFLWFVVWPLAKISAMVPVSIGGIGVREVALAVLLSPFGVHYATAVGYGFVWETVLIAGSLFGFLLTVLPIKNILSIKRLNTNKSIP